MDDANGLEGQNSGSSFEDEFMRSVRQPGAGPQVVNPPVANPEPQAAISPAANPYQQNVASQATNPQASNSQTVNPQTVNPQPNDDQAKLKKKLIIAIVAAVVMIIAVCVVFLIRPRGGEEEEVIPPVTDNELDESEAEGTWKLYGEDGNVVAVRITCWADGEEYSFLKDNSYSHFINEGLVDEGEYSIGDGALHLTSTMNASAFDISYNFEDFSIGDKQFVCDEYNDA